MSKFRALDIFKPFVGIVPEIELPYEKVVFDEKIVYTIGISALYLLSSLPISGVNPNKIADPFNWLRLPFASEAGTLLEFGVLPVLTSAFFWQILSGLKIVKINFNNLSDRSTFQSLQKISAVLIALIYATILAISGYFRPIDFFSYQNSLNSTTSILWSNILIIAQLTTSTAIVTLLVELLEKGYGFGPGVMVFITVSAATKFTGSLFGFITNIKSFESNGVIVQLFKNLFNKPLTTGIYSLFNRTDEVNFTQVYLTIIVVLILTYIQNFRMDISIKSTKVRSMVSTYPIRLFYCGALPILFSYTIIYNLNIITFALTKIFGGSNLIANWEIDSLTNNTYYLTSGLLYFISGSSYYSNFLSYIGKIIAFTAFTTFTSAIFGRYWYAMSGSTGKDLAKQFKEQDIVVVGHRDATVAKELNKLISSSSLIGATILGAVIGLAESTGLSKGLAVGVTTGLLCALSLLENVMSEYQQSGSVNSQFAQVFGTN